MTQEIRISEGQRLKNVIEAEAWVEKHNRENPDTHAQIEVMGNGNIRLTVSKKDVGNRDQVAPHP